MAQDQQRALTVEGESYTPSAAKDVPPNMEHIEARQQAVHNERHAFMATLTGHDREQFEAMDRASEILEAAKVPYYLTVDPDKTVERGVWQYVKLTYGDPFTSDKDAEEFMKRSWRMLGQSARCLSRPCAITVGFYNRQRELVGVLNPPEGDDKPE